MTNQQTDQQTDIRGYREFVLPIMIVVVGGMEEERWTRSSVGGLGKGGRLMFYNISNIGTLEQTRSLIFEVCNIGSEKVLCLSPTVNH